MAELMASAPPGMVIEFEGHFEPVLAVIVSDEHTYAVLANGRNDVEITPESPVSF